MQCESLWVELVRWIDGRGLLRDEVARRCGHEASHVRRLLEQPAATSRLRVFLAVLEAAEGRLEGLQSNDVDVAIHFLDEAREQAGISVSELARRAGLRRSHLSGLLSPRRGDMALETFEKLVEALGLREAVRIIPRESIAGPATGLVSGQARRRTAPLSVPEEAPERPAGERDPAELALVGEVVRLLDSARAAERERTRAAEREAEVECARAGMAELLLARERQRAALDRERLAIALAAQARAEAAAAVAVSERDSERKRRVELEGALLEAKARCEWAEAALAARDQRMTAMREPAAADKRDHDAEVDHKRTAARRPRIGGREHRLHQCAGAVILSRIDRAVPTAGSFIIASLSPVFMHGED